MDLDSNQRTWALAAHASGPAGLLLSAMLLGFLGPLVIYLAKRDESEFVADQAKEALNFQLTCFVLHVGLILSVVFTLGIALVLAIPLFALLWVLELVLGLVAALRAYEGHRYRYPIALRFLA